jgi:signal transduction histidine kinase/CHASE3 domain sensor protein/DNA-binding response OmpR family regulator
LFANRLILLAAVPLFLVLAAIVYLTAQFAINEREAQSWVRHTYQVIASIAQVRTDMQEAESGQRGYLITRRPQFLVPYNEGRQRISGHIATFRRLSADNPSEQRRADRLERLVRERFAALDRSLAAAAEGDDLTAMLESGKTSMEEIRREVSAGIAEENGLLRERDRTRRQTENLEIAFAIGAAVFTLGILIIAAAMLVRNNISLEASERSRANEAAILQATLDSVREGIAYFTAEGLLCAYNASFCELLGIAASQVRLQVSRLTEMQEMDLAFPPAARIFVRPALGEQPSDSQHIVRAGRELEVYRAPVATGGFLIGVVDVTARLRAEAMVRQSQKMEAIGHLTGGVAHDFNNLLQIISANLDLAVSAGNSAERLQERLQNAISAVARGSRLTGQLLAFARRQTLEPRSIDLGRVIRDTSEMLRRTLGERIEVETVIAGGLWNTLVDPSQVENMILNLAINARDAMPDGGKLTLEVANAMLDEAYAAGHAEVAPGQYVMLAVTDTGTGMTREVMARVFEPFFTTKPEGRGTGLGLAQAYGFVKQSGGHIKLYSEPGEGTTIKIYLPRTRREQDMIDTMPAGVPRGDNERVLVVEDDEGVRAAVVDMLGELGYRVLKAENAEEGLAVLEKQQVDLLFTDVVMPGAIPTREFTRRAQQMQPGLKVLYTSGYTQNSIVHNGKLDEDAVLLSKPYRRDELARKLRGVLSGAAPAPAAPAAARPAGPRGKVLVVEDVALIRMTTVDMAEQIGFDVVEAGDGHEALSVLDRHPDIAILLTDLGLPGMNGRELVEEVLRRRPDMKVVIATGYSTPGEEAPRGNVRFLTKPFDMAQLRRALDA